MTTQTVAIIRRAAEIIDTLEWARFYTETPGGWWSRGKRGFTASVAIRRASQDCYPDPYAGLHEYAGPAMRAVTDYLIRHGMYRPVVGQLTGIEWFDDAAPLDSWNWAAESGERVSETLRDVARELIRSS